MRFDDALREVLGEYGAFTKRVLAIVTYEEIFFATQVTHDVC